jgi:hypothetical protein
MLRKILVIAAALLFIQSLNAELDWNITGSGARAAGMGNAFIGIADDATAINWNPGGLTALEHFEASVVGSSNFDGEEYLVEDNQSYSYEEELSYSHINLNFLSMAYPFKIDDKKFVLAAAFQKQLDFFSEDAWESTDEDYEYSSEGGVYTANLGASYQALPYLSFGATANIWTGKSESDQVYSSFVNSYSESSYSENTGFSGFNFVIGALFDMSAIKENVPLKIGAVVKTPFDLEYDFYQEYIFDDIYNDANDYTEEYSYSGIVEIPLMFGLGASYRFGENFTLGVDFERRNYAKSKFISEYDDGSTYESYMTASEEDVNQFRIGMEYLIITDAMVIPVRMGFFNYPTLWSNYDYEWDGANYVEVDSEQLVGYGLSAGSGIILENFSLDLSLSVLKYENEHNYDDLNGYEWSQTWTNTKNTLNLSAVVYLDTFINK